MRLIYNIAANKRIVWLKLIIFTSFFILLSLFFILVGTYKIQSIHAERQGEVKKLRHYQSKWDDIERKENKYEKHIDSLKSKWERRVKVANLLLAKKKFSVINKFNILEELLPEGVYIIGISLSYEKKSDLFIKIMASSFSRLIEFYKNFSRLNLIIKKETESNGIYRADVILRIDNEKEN